MTIIVVVPVVAINIQPVAIPVVVQSGQELLAN